MKPATLFAIVACALAPAGCRSGGAEPEPSGFLTDYARLAPSPTHPDVLVWSDPEADWSRYHRILIEPVMVVPVPGAESKDYDVARVRKQAKHLRRTLEQAVMGRYPIAGEPGPDVLRLRVALTDIRRARPLLNQASGASMEAEFTDSLSGKKLFTCVDAWKRSRISASESLAKLDALDAAAEWWAQALSDFLRERVGY